MSLVIVSPDPRVVESSAAATSMGEDGSAEKFFEPSLFVDLNYITSSASFGDVSIAFKALQSGATDFDLTGQIVWPASMLLSSYIKNHSDEFRGLSVLEVGSGIGVSGLIAAKFADTQRVVLSDYNELVVDVLRQNVALNFPPENAPVCAILNWGHDMDVFLERHKPFDCIIGADVVYWPDACQPLFETVAYLLSHKPSAHFLLSYISRSLAMDQKLRDMATKYGFVGEAVDLARENLQMYKDAMIVKLTRAPGAQ